MFIPVSLAYYSYFGGDIGNFLLQLEQLGVFSYLLPFLIIFSLVFGILTRINIFEDNKGINAVISLSVSLMALQFGFVSVFFSEIFPRVGIGLSVILVVLIFLGLFLDPETSGARWTMFGIGLIVLLVILVTSFDSTSFSYGFWWRENMGLILILGAVVAIMAIITASGKPATRGGNSPLERALRGN